MPIQYSLERVITCTRRQTTHRESRILSTAQKRVFGKIFIFETHITCGNEHPNMQNQFSNWLSSTTWRNNKLLALLIPNLGFYVVVHFVFFFLRRENIDFASKWLKTSWIEKKLNNFWTLYQVGILTNFHKLPNSDWVKIQAKLNEPFQRYYFVRETHLKSFRKSKKDIFANLAD